MKLVHQSLPLALCPLFFLSGCATHNDLNEQSTKTTAGPAPAVYVQANSPTAQKQVITEYVPVPVPGQLMPTPSAAESKPMPNFTNPEQAVDYANKNSTQQPSANSFFNSMMTYNYTDGALYTIYTAPLKITDISLAPGEKLISEAAGDTLRWQIAQTYSGAGNTLTQHLLIKPNQSGLQNTVVITTDQHVYHLVLQSTDDSYMASVSWNYPNNMVSFANTTPGQNAGPAAPTTPNVDVSQLDFGYQYSLVLGSKPNWYPVRIFNDGRQTYIQLPSDYLSNQMPVLYIADNNGGFGTMVNWRYRSPYIIVDTVLHNARLQTGVDNTGTTIVQIKHT